MKIPLCRSRNAEGGIRNPEFQPSHPAPPAPDSCGGFTLVEVMVAMATTLIVIGAALAVYLYTLRMLEFTKPKLEANDQARKAMAVLTDDVRSSHKINLGNLSGGAFTELPEFSTQIASAMRIYPSLNTNRFVIYYWSGGDQTLRRTTDNSAGAIIASAVTNAMVFTAEDYRGLPYTNQNSSMVIGVSLHFNQIQYPKTAIGPGNYYDYYHLRAKINKRAYF